jgi:hypothetical protein
VGAETAKDVHPQKTTQRTCTHNRQKTDVYTSETTKQTCAHTKQHSSLHTQQTTICQQNMRAHTTENNTCARAKRNKQPRRTEGGGEEHYVRDGARAGAGQVDEPGHPHPQAGCGVGQGGKHSRQQGGQGRAQSGAGGGPINQQQDVHRGPCRGWQGARPLGRRHRDVDCLGARVERRSNIAGYRGNNVTDIEPIRSVRVATEGG